MTVPTYHKEPLILEQKWEKSAAGQRLPENTMAWPQLAMKYVAEDVPYVLDGTNVDVSIQEADPESGAGFGMVIITNQPPPPRTGPSKQSYGPQKAQTADTGYDVRKIAIPFIVENFKLYPYDIFMDDEGKWHRMSPKRYEEVMFRPTPFVGTEGRSSPSSTISDRTSVPPEMAFGFGARGGNSQMSRSASAPVSQPQSILNRVLEAMGHKVRCHWMQDKDTTAVFKLPDRLELIRKYTQRHAPTGDDYTDAAQSIMPLNVLRVRSRGDRTYEVIEITDGAYLPRQKVMDGEELMNDYDARVPGIIGIVEDKGGDAVITVDHNERTPLILDEIAPKGGLITQSGKYVVATETGEMHQGQVWPLVRGFNGEDLGLKLFSNGQVFGAQGALIGESIDGPASFDMRSEPETGEWTAFLNPNGVESIVPFRLDAKRKFPCCGTMREYLYGSTIFGDQLVVCREEGVGRVYSASGAAHEMVAQWVNQAIYNVPADWPWVPLGRQVTICYNPKSYNTSVRTKIEAGVHVIPAHKTPTKDTDNASLIVSVSQDGTYVLNGMVLNHVAGKERVDNASEKDAIFLLVVLGLGVEGARDVLDSARSRRRVTVANLLPVTPLHAKTAQFMAARSELEDVCDGLRRDLFKEAAHLEDQPTVDAILSLNFISPETLDVFLEELPALQNAEQTLARLLLYTRVGMKEMPEVAVINALKGLNVVNETLEYLKSYGQPGVEQSMLNHEMTMGQSAKT